MKKFAPSPEQQAILAHNLNQNARILAGPGTGKSATLVALVNEASLNRPDLKVRMLTFTRAATGELARKVSERPTLAAQRPSTIHSFALSILLLNPGAGNLPQPLRIADDWEYKNIVQKTLSRRIDVPATELKLLFRELAANWQSLNPEENPKISPEKRGKFLGGWNEHRNILGYTLLDELPFALMNTLKNHPAIKGLIYDALIVDEYQDLNSCDL